jgi:hypothetical protein
MIPISKKHGLNPSISLCFWCGEECGIALLGRLPDDIKAPKHCLLDYTPCKNCQKIFKQGGLIVECDTKPLSSLSGQPPIQDNLYPTGRFAVLKLESLKHLVSQLTLSDERKQSILKQNRLIVSTEFFSTYIAPLLEKKK